MSQLMLITQVMININNAQQDSNSDNVVLPVLDEKLDTIAMPEKPDFDINDLFKKRE